MAGDLGGAFGPSLVGAVTQRAGDDLQAGMLAGSVFPLVLVFTLILFSRTAQKNGAGTSEAEAGKSVTR